ncbi:MAG TPA: hypothetical protein VJU18_02285 [Vicinamibacteria bacterium]|nr:hypothetical protein [Vicinamibacteria bacterium]
MKPARVVLAAVSFLAVLGLASPARAQGGVGFRAGVSSDPDQLYVGGHADIGPLEGPLWLRPNIEVGVGNDLTTISLNGELAYWLRPRRSPWRLYVAFGPALNLYRWGDEGRHADRETDAEIGFGVGVGLVHRGSFFVEFKLGALDSPEAKIGVGWTFR